MNFNWLTSKTVREANAMCKHVHKLLQHQRDILSAKAISEGEDSVHAVREATVGKVDGNFSNRESHHIGHISHFNQKDIAV